MSETSIKDLMEGIEGARSAAMPDAANLGDFRLLDMPPCFAMNNHVDLAGVALKHSSDVLLHDALSVQLAHQPNIVLCEASRPDPFPFNLPLFLAHVGHVVLMSAKKQTQRIGAWPIVAPMQYVKPVRNRAVMNDPRVTMSVDVMTSNAIPNKRIPFTVKATSPAPAVDRLLAFDDVSPEAVDCWDAHGSMSARATAKRLASNLSGRAIKRHSACLTNTVGGLRLGEHADLHPCVTPPAVTSSAGATLFQWSLIIPQTGVLNK